MKDAIRAVRMLRCGSAAPQKKESDDLRSKPQNVLRALAAPTTLPPVCATSISVRVVVLHIELVLVRLRRRGHLARAAAARDDEAGIHLRQRGGSERVTG